MMKPTKSIKFLITAVVFVSFFQCKSNQNVCRLTEIKTLYSDVEMHVGVDTGYAHTVLIKDFAKECIDSAVIVNIALKYKDTVKGPKPVDIIAFYNSDKDFIPNENSQDMQAIDKSCLVKIGFIHKTKKPNFFVFYNEDGNEVYSGEKWKPHDK